MLIGLDLDDVIADFIPSFLEFYNNNYNSSLTRDNVSTYKLWYILGITQEKAVQRMIEFYDSPYFRDIRPVVGSMDAINVLNQNHKLCIITSRLEQGIGKTRRWIIDWFPSKFGEIYFAKNTYAQDKKEKSKLEICLDLNVRFLVEDSLEYTQQCAEKGINVLLLNTPWNQANKLPENVTRVKSWNEIVNIINRHKA